MDGPARQRRGPALRLLADDGLGPRAFRPLVRPGGLFAVVARGACPRGLDALAARGPAPARGPDLPLPTGRQSVREWADGGVLERGIVIAGLALRSVRAPGESASRDGRGVAMATDGQAARG